MINKSIEIRNEKQAVQFVNIAARYPYHIDLVKGSQAVDGKSILGVLGLTVGHKVQMRVYADRADEFLENIRNAVGI